MHGHHQTIIKANLAAASIKAAVRGNKSVKCKAIVVLVQVRDGTNIQHYRKKLYIAKEEVIEDMEGKWQSHFSLFATHLLELRRVNQDSTVALKVY